MAEGDRPDAQDETHRTAGDAGADGQPTELESLRQETESLRGKVDAYLDLAQRTQADFANYRKRIEREREADAEVAQAGLMRSLLSIFDDLDRAVSVAPAPTEGSWSEGVRLIHRKVQQWFEAHQVRRVDRVGEPFDPAVHEAVAYEERPGFAEGQVATVMRPGYVMSERVLRPAQVTVARGDQAASSEAGSSDTARHERSSMLHGGGE